MSHQFGFFLGPPIGGLIIDLIDWRGTFFFIAFIGLVGIVLTYVAKGSHEVVLSGRRAPVDYLGATLFVLLAVIVTFLLDQKSGEVLYLSPTFMGILFLAPSILGLILAPLSGHVADRVGPRIPMLVGASFLGIAFLIGAMLGKQSHWLLPAAVLGFLGVGYSFHNNPIQAAMTIALPKEHWGSAVGIIHTIFGFGHILGISGGSVLLTFAFQYYSGMPNATPDPGNPLAFVSSINLTFALAVGMALVAISTALTHRGAMRRALELGSL